MLILMIFSTFVELLSLSSIPVFLIAITDSNTFQNKFPFFNDLFSLDLKKLFFIFKCFNCFIIHNKKFIFIFCKLLPRKFKKRVRENIKKKIFQKYLNEKYIFHLNHNPSLLIRNITHDSIHASDTLFIMLTIFKEFFLLISIFLLLIFTTSTNTLLLIILLSAVSYFVYFFLKNHIKKAGIEYREYTGFVLKNLIQSFGSIKETKIFRRENYFKEIAEKNIHKIEN